ncbi:MAG: CRISPR-associated endonuclease Cas2, partial [candidate division WOR-3 bacterium]
TEKGEQKRLASVMKICRKYLHHIQKSVFEGNLTEAKLKKMELEILRKIDKNRDSVIIYTFPETISFQRKILTNVKKITDNII